MEKLTKNWEVGLKDNFNSIYSFFKKMEIMESPTFSFPNGIEGTLNEIFDKGRILVGKQDEFIRGLCGYFHGIPKMKKDFSFEFENKNVAYVYFLVTEKNFRKNFPFGEIVSAISKQALVDGHDELRFKAYRDNNILLNKLYSRFAEKIGVEKNTQNKWTNLYSANPKNFI